MSSPVVYVIDDDVGIRQSMGAMLRYASLAVQLYGSAKAFLSDEPAARGCVVTDIRMPEMDGLELQDEINRRGLGLPVIIMTGHGDVPLAVKAMRAGASDFIEKPFDNHLMLSSIKRAIEQGERARDRESEARSARDLLALLTPRERHVLDQLVAGRSNKVAAYELGISPRTIEIHRARIMDKMRARSLSDLVRTAITAAAPAGGFS